MKKKDPRDWAKVKEGFVDSYLKRYGLPTDGEARERAERLEAHFFAQPEPRLECSVKTGGCGFHAPKSLDECPFCGDKEVDPGLDSQEVAGKSEEKLVQTKKNKKKSPEVAAETNTSGVDGPTGPPPAPLAARPPDLSVEVHDERDLDAAVVRIRELDRRGLENQYELGLELWRVYEKKLYLLRRDKETGAPLYRSFEQFLKAEFDYSGVHVWRFIEVAKEFDKPTALALGVKKANLLHEVRVALDMSAKTDAQKEASQKRFDSIVEEAKSKTYSVVEAEVAPIIKAAPQLAHGKRGKGGRPKGRLDRAAPEQRDRITTAVEVGETVLPLYVHGTKVADDKRAKKLSDSPFAVEETLNGVRVRYEIRIGAKGFLELVKRVTPPA